MDIKVIRIFVMVMMGLTVMLFISRLYASYSHYEYGDGVNPNLR